MKEILEQIVLIERMQLDTRTECFMQLQQVKKLKMMLQEQVKNCSILHVSGSALLSKARQMRLEQQKKIDSYTEYYNDYEIGTLNGIDRIVKLIERHYR